LIPEHNKLNDFRVEDRDIKIQYQWFRQSTLVKITIDFHRQIRIVVTGNFAQDKKCQILRDNVAHRPGDNLWFSGIFGQLVVDQGVLCKTADKPFQVRCVDCLDERPTG